MAIIQSIAQICQDLNLVSDNTPPSMASGCIYLYVKDNEMDISKKDIADICQISEVTVNKCYKKLDSNEIISDFMKGLKGGGS